MISVGQGDLILQEGISSVNLLYGPPLRFLPTVITSAARPYNSQAPYELRLMLLDLYKSSDYKSMLYQYGITLPQLLAKRGPVI